jgi:poly(3-hydroxybutyrate) depolymerase
MIVFHGDHDRMVNHVNADRLVDQGIRAFSTAAEHGDAPRHGVTTRRDKVPGGHSYTRAVYQDANGNTLIEHWTIHGGGHAWSGGSRQGSYTDPQGPDASAELLRFFAEHSLLPLSNGRPSNGAVSRGVRPRALGS